MESNKEELKDKSAVASIETTAMDMDSGNGIIDVIVDKEKNHNQNKLESELQGDMDAADGQAILITSPSEVKINMEAEITDSSNNAPVLPLSKLSDDTASSVAEDGPGQGHTVEFSEEKDAPKMSMRVYDFDMVKEKTLPRRVQLGGRQCFRFCSSQPRSHLLEWSLMGVGVVVCSVIFIVYWMME